MRLMSKRYFCFTPSCTASNYCVIGFVSNPPLNLAPQQAAAYLQGGISFVGLLHEYLNPRSGSSSDLAPHAIAYSLCPNCNNIHPLDNVISCTLNALWSIAKAYIRMSCYFSAIATIIGTHRHTTDTTAHRSS